jgi:hypothetical protein
MLFRVLSSSRRVGLTVRASSTIGGGLPEDPREEILEAALLHVGKHG